VHLHFLTKIVSVNLVKICKVRGVRTVRLSTVTCGMICRYVAHSQMSTHVRAGSTEREMSCIGIEATVTGFYCELLQFYVNLKCVDINLL